MTTTIKTSPKMDATLASICSAWTDRVRFARRLHGIDDARALAAGGISWANDRATVEALAARGLVRIRRDHHVTESLRRGHYGRWIGGTTRRGYTALRVSPTPAGFAYLKTR